MQAFQARDAGSIPATRSNIYSILITGAAHGIGYASSIALARRGHAVIASDIKAADFEPLIAVAKKEGLTITCIALDVGQEADWSKALEYAPDVLINNAGIGESGPLIDIPLERVRKNFETNVFGTLGLTQLVGEQMLQRGAGRIIIVGSTAGLVTLPFLGAYNMTKYALEAASDALRMELQPRGIHVSLIEPGKIKTGFNQGMTATKYEWLQDGGKYDIEKMRAYDASFFADEHPVDVVVRDVVHAVESTRPRARYISPRRISPTILLARLLPERFRDRIFRKMAGLE